MPSVNLNEFEKQAKESQGGGVFLKVTETPTVFVPKGDAYVYYQNFTTKQISEVPFTGGSWKFKINVAILENGKWVAKILNGGSTLAGQISQHMKKFGKGNAFAVHKKGKLKDTEYFVMYEKKLDSEDIEQIKALRNFDLAPKDAVEQEMPSGIPLPDEPDVLPEDQEPF